MINVNLLPPEIKEEQSQAKRNSYTLRLIFLTSTIILCAGAVFGGVLFYFMGQLDNVNKELSQKEQSIKKYGDLEDRAKIISDKINTITQIISGTNIWSGVTQEIQNITPAGVSLTSVRIDSNTKTRNQIIGRAASKKEVAALRDAMEKSERFEFVDIETSTTKNDQELKKDIEEFTITFSLAKGALK